MSDTKISGLPVDTSPTTDDYIPAVDSGSGTTKRTLISSLITLFFNNIPDNTVKSPALALSNALDSTNGVKSQANSGSAGGTLYYVNLGGIKILWGTTSSIAVNSTVIGKGINFPSSFFSTIQSAIATPTHLTTDDRVTNHLESLATSGMTLVLWNTSGATTSTASVSFMVIGT